MAASRGDECKGWPLRVAVMPGKYIDFRHLFSMLTLDACCQISSYPLERHLGFQREGRGHELQGSEFTLQEHPVARNRRIR